MYLRFVVPNQQNEIEQQTPGVLAFSCELRDSFAFSGEEFIELCKCIDWFVDNLEIPPMYEDPALGQTTSWFKATAGDHLLRIETLVEFLRSHGIPVDCITSNQPGKVLFEDLYQILVSA